MDPEPHHHGGPGNLPVLRVADKNVIDPVCGMTVDPAKAAGKFEHKGTTYYFCSRGCVEKFSKQPDVYLMPKPAAGEMQLPVLQLGGACTRA